MADYNFFKKVMAEAKSTPSKLQKPVKRRTRLNIGAILSAVRKEPVKPLIKTPEETPPPPAQERRTSINSMDALLKLVKTQKKK